MKKFSAVFLSSIFSILFFQCGPDYQTNKRILIKGQLHNQAGEPLRNLDVSAYTLTEEYFQGSQPNGYLLGRNDSGVEGTIEVVCMLDVNSDFLIKVNGNDDYLDFSYVFKTDLAEPENLLIDMGEVVLRKKANVTINITRTSPEDTPLEYVISYENPLCAVVYEDSSLIMEESTCYEQTTISRSFNGTEENETNLFDSVLGSNFMLTYSVDSQPQVTETITIDQSNFVYEFTY